MEDSFKVRVDRLFGSRLFESVPRSSFPDSSWSVTEGDVERKEWNREGDAAFPGREDMPCASAYDECFAKRTGRSGAAKKHRFEDDLDDEEEEEGEGKGGEEDGDDAESEAGEIRSSIGLDSTLDYEEEEDEYDRAAVGSENADNRVYMKDVKDHGPFMNYHTIVEDSNEEVHFARDPRADHMAARERLKEDKEACGSFHLDSIPNDVAPKIKVTESDVNLKPILKRKGDQNDSRPRKHVRFGFGCKDYQTEQINASQDSSMVPESTEATRSSESSGLPPKDYPQVPDYIRNPSKYVRYTFDSEDDVDDGSNRRAFDDFWKIVSPSKSEDMQPDGVMEPLKSVIFTPKKRTTEKDIPKESSVHVSVRSVGIAAVEATDNEVCAMEDDSDVPVGKPVGSQKSYRQYRSRTPSDDSG